MVKIVPFSWSEQMVTFRECQSNKTELSGCDSAIALVVMVLSGCDSVSTANSVSVGRCVGSEVGTAVGIDDGLCVGVTDGE